MRTRLYQLEEARTIILEKVLILSQEKSVISKKMNIVEAFLMLENQNLLIIGKDNRFYVNNLDNRKIENMLNILQQYSLIREYTRVCGNVFRIIILIKPTGKTKIISIKNI